MSTSKTTVYALDLTRLAGSGLTDTIGFLPYRHPIVSVVGRPIRVTQADNPSMAQMQDVQQRYIAELTRCVRSLSLPCTSRVNARLADVT